ncbi:MAG: hypothetical protein IJ833_07970 [Lachnospiraceae bacterium]|nr:hypothetical protein [Lachnospiraceae bacterium]
MNKEMVFAQTLERVRVLAKEQGNMVSEDQVQEAFATLGLDNDQLQLVYDYLVKHKVGIGQPVNPDDYLTDEERDYLQTYLDEIALLPTYTEGEREGYTLSAMAGDAEAQARVVEMYLKDVVDVAKLYAGQGVFLEDLIGEGNVALAMGVSMLGSLEKPAEAQGMLGKLMMDAMEDYIAEHAANEKMDKKVEDKVNKVADKARELAEDLHRKVTVEELAAETGMSAKTIQDAMRMSGFRIEDIEEGSGSSYAEDNL